MNPGDVVWIDFPGVVQTKRRPAIVLSSAAYHAARPDLIVGLVTSQTTKATSPTDYIIKDWKKVGLRLPSDFRAFILTLPRSAVASKIGTLDRMDWDEVVARVKLAMKLD